MGVVAGVVVVAVVSEVDLAAVAELVVSEEIFVAAFETIDIDAKYLCQIPFEVLYLPSNMIRYNSVTWGKMLTFQPLV